MNPGNTMIPHVCKWMRALPILGLLTLLPFLAAAGGIQSSVASGDPELIALGARLFDRNCSPCHGKEAVGEDPAKTGGGWKEGVGQIAPALNGAGHAWHHPPGYFFQMIHNGTSLPDSRMISWQGRMSEYEILAVIAYFQSLWPERIRKGYLHRYAFRVWE